MNGKFAMVLMGLVALAVVAWLLVDGTQQATPDYESEEPGRDQEPGRERAQDPDQDRDQDQDQDQGQDRDRDQDQEQDRDHEHGPGQDQDQDQRPEPAAVEEAKSASVRVGPAPRPIAVDEALLPVTPRANGFVMSQEASMAVRNAVTWLKKRQQRDGSWGAVRGSGVYGSSGALQDVKPGGGPTALAVYALLGAGTPASGPRDGPRHQEGL